MELDFRAQSLGAGYQLPRPNPKYQPVVKGKHSDFPVWEGGQAGADLKQAQSTRPFFTVDLQQIGSRSTRVYSYNGEMRGDMFELGRGKQRRKRGEKGIGNEVVVSNERSTLSEMRGAVVDVATRRLLIRPYHKFWEISKSGAHKPTKIAEWGTQFEVIAKLDGTMIAATWLDEELVLTTRNGATARAGEVHSWVQAQHNYAGYMELVRVANEGAPHTVLWEFLTPNTATGTLCATAQLVLTGIRNNETGAYHSYEEMAATAAVHGLEVVNRRSEYEYRQIADIVSMVKSEVGTEGVVLRFMCGRHVKVKTEWYKQAQAQLEGVRMNATLLTVRVRAQRHRFRAKRIEQGRWAGCRVAVLGWRVRSRGASVVRLLAAMHGCVLAEELCERDCGRRRLLLVTFATPAHARTCLEGGWWLCGDKLQVVQAYSHRTRVPYNCELRRWTARQVWQGTNRRGGGNSEHSGGDV